MNTGLHVFKQAVTFLQNIEPIFDNEISLLKQIGELPAMEIDKTKIDSVASSVWEKIKKWQTKNSVGHLPTNFMSTIVTASGYKWWNHETSDGTVEAWVFHITKNEVDVIWKLPMPDGSTICGIGKYHRLLIIGEGPEKAVYEPSDIEGWKVGEPIPIVKGKALLESVLTFISEKDKEWRNAIIDSYEDF